MGIEVALALSHLQLYIANVGCDLHKKDHGSLQLFRALWITAFAKKIAKCSFVSRTSLYPWWNCALLTISFSTTTISSLLWNSYNPWKPKWSNGKVFSLLSLEDSICIWLGQSFCTMFIPQWLFHMAWILVRVLQFAQSVIQTAWWLFFVIVRMEIVKLELYNKSEHIWICNHVIYFIPQFTVVRIVFQMNALLLSDSAIQQMLNSIRVTDVR